MRPLILALALLALLPATASAGPWAPDPGAGYLKVQARWLPGVGWFPGPESEQMGPRLYGIYNEVFLGGFYGEIGLAPRLAVTLHSDGLRLFVLDGPEGPAQAHVSLGEPAFGLKLHAVQAGPFAAGLSAFVRLPTMPNTPVQDVVAVDGTGDVIGALRIGTGVFEGGGNLELGLGLKRVYFAGAVGVAKRSGGWDSVLSWSVEGGWTAGKLQRTRLRLRLAGAHPLGDGTAPYHASPSGIGNGTRYVGFTLELERVMGEHLTLGVSLAGGLGPVVRQTGGPVITGYAAWAW